MSEPAMHLKITIYDAIANISQQEAEHLVKHLYNQVFIKTDNVSIEIEKQERE